MTKHIGLKAINQGTALAMGTLALPPLVIEGLEEFSRVYTPRIAVNIARLPDLLGA